MPKYIKSILPGLYGACFNLLSIISPSLAAKKAFFTFTRVRKGRVLPQQQAFLENAKAGHVQAAGLELQTYHWTGAGQTVLLVHGWESNSFRWKNLIGYLLENGFDVRAFDAPAHGYSGGTHMPVPLYSDCLLELIRKYRPSYLIAHSVGGMTALFTQYRNPDNSLEKIVTIGAPSEFHEILEQYRRLLHLNKRVMNALYTVFHDKYGFHIRDFSSSVFARSINIKGLLVHDKFDTIAPFHASEKVHEQWRDSLLLATEGLGHSIHQEEVNKKIVRFLIS